MVDGPKELVSLLVALGRQTGLISREDIAFGSKGWSAGEGPSAGRDLSSLGALDPETYRLLEALGAKLVAAQGGDLARALAVLGGVGPVEGSQAGEGPATLLSLPTLATGPEEALDSLATRDPSEGSYATRPELEGSAVSGRGVETLASFGPIGRALGLASAGRGSRFRILRPHARGGLGEVYVAHDEEVGRVVALKEIQDQHADHPESRSRFLLEAEVTGNLEHPGIVPVYGLGQYADGRPYYAMRFIQGDSLKEAIEQFHAADRPGRDPGERALGLSKLLGRFVDVCEAIAFAHSKGVLHRDLKPGNIMLGKYGETLVVDWGLAKAMGRPETDAGPGQDPSMLGSGNLPSQTRAGSAMGTPQFMSPEQAEGRIEDLGPASDVYSLGATLYQLLAGRVPFGDRDASSVIDAVKRGEFPPPRRVNPKVPAALEAICLKAMALTPGGRYPDPKALAEDVERWLADEPVTAWREPWSIKASRWVARRRTPVIAASASLAVALAAVGYVAYDSAVRHAEQAARRLAEARGHVEALAAAEITSVPEILVRLDSDRFLVRDHLEAMANSDANGAEGRRHRLHATLALLPDESGRLGAVAERLVQAETRPEEVTVICGVLRASGLSLDVVIRLKDHLPAPGSACDDRQLRAAAAVAALAAEDPIWKTLGGSISARLVRENPIRLGAWSEAFRPVAMSLIGSLRDDHFTDRGRPETDRAAAFTLLTEFAPPGRAGVADLVALVPDSDPDQFESFVARLLADRTLASSLLADRLKPDDRPDPSSADRRGRVAAALARLGRADQIWPLLVHSPRPDVRTEIVHDLARYRVDVAELTSRIGLERDISARRALVLALGEYELGAIPPEARPALIDRLLGWYRDDPDAGIHGAVDWLLRRRWGRVADLDRLNAALAGRDPIPGRDWFVNGRGQSFAVVRGPVEFLEGSPPEEVGRHANEAGVHRVRIARSFALDAREMTVERFVEYLAATAPESVDSWVGTSEFKQHVPEPDCPIGRANWYEAVAYCNWLSRMEGIPEDQWCYPKSIRSGMTLPPDWLKRTGYRLPTEAEWEHACRAGAVTSRPFGESMGPLPAYAWSVENAENRTHPVGLLKPNDLGLFDMLGNALEWTADSYFGPGVFKPGGAIVADEGATDPQSPNRVRVAKSQSANDPSIYFRSASRTRVAPGTGNVFYGFRLARTCL